MEFTDKSSVYIKVDSQNRILRCEGGYTEINIMSNMTYDGKEDRWIKIDEGVGDRYNLCQVFYFDRLYTDDGIPRWKWDNGLCLLRTTEELDMDRQGFAASGMSPLK